MSVQVATDSLAFGCFLATPEAGEAEEQAADDRGRHAPSRHERRRDRPDADGEVSESELLGDLAGAGVRFTEDVLHGERRTRDLTDPRDEQARADAPEQEPPAVHGYRVAADDQQFDRSRDDGQDEGLEQNHDDVHAWTFLSSGLGRVRLYIRKLTLVK